MRPFTHGRSRRSLAVAVAAAVLVPTLGLSTPVAADDRAVAEETEGLAWAVSPVPPKGKTAAPRNYFILEGAPGTVVKDRVLIQNFTPEPITFQLYGADGYNTDGKGGFALRNREFDHVDLGSWIEPAIDQVTVFGETAATVPVRFRIPDNATPGDHAGGVVAINTAIETRSEGTMSFGVQRAIAARAYVRVSGNTSPGLEVRDVEVTHDRGLWPWSGQGKGTVSYTVENTGNLRLSPSGTVTVNGLGADTSSSLGRLNDLLPGSEVTLTHEISGVPGLGPVEVEVAYDGGDGLVVRDSASFTLVPWPLALAVLLALAGATVWWLRRRDAIRRRLKEASATPKITVTEEEPVAS